MKKKEKIEILLKMKMKMMNEKSIKIYHPDIYEDIINYNKNYLFHKKEKFIAKIFNYINNQKSGECIVCGNPTLFKRKINGYKLYCSQKCYDEDDKKIISEKIKTIWNEKYGGHPASNEKVKEKKTIEKYTNEKKKGIRLKYKETCINKYGVDSPLKNKEVSNKRNSTIGNKKSYLLEITKNKIKITNILKYGFSVAVKNKKISNKIKIANGKKTIEEKKAIFKKMKKSIKKFYGVEHQMHNSIIKNKMMESHKKRTVQEKENTKNKTRLTSLKKYGTNHSSQSKEIKEKSIMKFKTRYYEILNKNLNEIVFHGLTFEKYLNGNLRNKIDFKCKKCGTTFNDYINYHRLPKCPICFPHSYSKSEKEIFDYVKIDLGLNAIKQDKNILDGKEIDILIPEKKLGIEYHGLMYHSFGKDTHSPFNNLEFESFKKNRHIEKQKKSNDKDINLLQIFENEWKDLKKKEIWRSMINNKLGKIEQKVFARKCTIKEVGIHEKNEFLENNHLQGKDNSRIKLGLYYNDELVQIMTFGVSRYNKDINWEMHRFSTKKNLIVVGGASKLFNHFENNFLQKGETVVTYADLRYATGKVYQTLGFVYSHSSTPNFFYFKKGSYILESRISFQKHKLKDKLKIYDENLSANENMFNNGYRRIWDYGNKVYVYEKKDLI